MFSDYIKQKYEENARLNPYLNGEKDKEVVKELIIIPEKVEIKIENFSKNLFFYIGGAMWIIGTALFFLGLPLVLFGVPHVSVTGFIIGIIPSVIAEK